MHSQKLRFQLTSRVTYSSTGFKTRIPLSELSKGPLWLGDTFQSFQIEDLCGKEVLEFCLEGNLQEMDPVGNFCAC